MTSNFYIILTSVITFALGELDFAVHVKGAANTIFIPSLHIYTGYFLLGGPDAAERLAEKHHMVNMGEIIPETGYFLLRTKVFAVILISTFLSFILGKQSEEEKSGRVETCVPD